jgi:hypothetical protein
MQQKTSPWLKPWIERIAHSIQSPQTQEWIQLYLLDPIITYILERCFPYFVVFTVIFGILFILLIVMIVFMFIHINARVKPIIPDVLL